MRNGSPYLGGGRYIQAAGAAGLLGSELKRLGVHRALIIGGRTALSVARGKFEPELRQNGIQYEIAEFSGHCTLVQCSKYGEMAGSFGADIIVGVGGGKVLDTAKMVANNLNLGVVTVPTSAATCAAYAVLSVIYNEAGDVLYSVFHNREVLCVLVDLDILIHDCPARMLASGIADAAAKYPEIAFSIDYSPDWEKTILPSTALALSKFTWDAFFEKGGKALESALEKKNSVELEDCLCAGIALTGTVSSLVSGGKQLAIAHTFYDSVCKYFKAQQKKYLHGEIVSAGILLQMYVNGMDGSEIGCARSFLKGLGTPVSIEDLGIERNAENTRTIFRYIVEAMGLKEEWMTDRLKEGLERII